MARDASAKPPICDAVLAMGAEKRVREGRWDDGMMGRRFTHRRVDDQWGFHPREGFVKGHLVWAGELLDRLVSTLMAMLDLPIRSQ